MILRTVFIVFGLITLLAEVKAQCVSPINSFPYQEGFENSDGGWIPGGVGSDWTWGTPTKPVISTAGGGTKSWVIGGLTNSSYTNSEASWLQSPCFDFSSLQYPLISFKVFWEMEQRFDGASLQYSIDNGLSWITAGSANDPVHCLNQNWYNNSAVTYLAPLASNRHGWSGNIQTSSGSCNGGNGSNGWVTASHVMPYLANEPSVIFRFIFGAGTICNSYDGFAIDDFYIGEAPANQSLFSYECAADNKVNFNNESTPCPTGFSWDFDDPASGSNNISTIENPVHIFSAPGSYNVKLTVTGPGNAPASIIIPVKILSVTPTIIKPAECISGKGGEAFVTVNGDPGPFTYSWNTNPVQTTQSASNLSAQSYTVTVSSAGSCPVSAEISIPVEPSCTGIYFPTAFTPGTDGKNDWFGPIGNLTSLTGYRLSVFNRWGEIVFRSNDPFQQWDGQYKDLRSGSHIFVWHASFTMDGKKQSQKGTIMLIR